MTDKTEYQVNPDTGEVAGQSDGEPNALTAYNTTDLMPYDDTQQIALLPERLTWDKKAGKFVSEILETDELEFRLVASMFLWAKWSDQVGQPEDVQAGGDRPGDDYTPGIRLMLEVEDLGFYYLDCWGIAFKFAQGVVKHARTSGGLVKCKGSKAINTKFGVFALPKIVRE
jgi:hypothetical protein